MKTFEVVWLGGAVTLVALAAVGCGSGQPRNQVQHTAQPTDQVVTPVDESATAMASLPETDRPLAKAQGYCAVSEAPLGSMGTPIKLSIRGEPVFICCKGCERKAKATEERVLAKANKLKKRVESETVR